MTPISHLSEIGACSSAISWVMAGKFSDLESAWLACEEPQYLLWYAGRKSGGSESDGRKKLVLCAMACAKLALPIWEKRYPKDDRVRVCIETAEKWAHGDATISDVRLARQECRKAAYAAADALTTATESAYAAYAAADAAAYAYAYAERKRVLKLCADIVHKFYPTLPA